MKENPLILLLYIILCCGLFMACPNTNVNITPVPENTPPTAEAGDSFIQNVDIDGTVIPLDASLSVDPDGDDLSFLWELQTVPSGCLLETSNIVNNTSEHASLDINGSQLTADPVSGLIEFIFQLTVSDGEDESVDTLTVTIEGSGSNGIEENTPPTADAGDSFIQNVDIDGTVIPLDASLSVDPDGDDLSFLWELQTVPSGCLLETSNIANNTSEHAFLDINGSQLTADPVSGLIEFVFQLTVSDGEDESVDTVAVTIEGSSSINIGVF